MNSSGTVSEIKTEEVVFSYDRDSTILNGIDLLIERNTILGILGPNGSGKTTLIKCLNRILNPGGTILLNNTDIRKLSRTDIAKKLGYVPQSSSDNAALPCVYEVVLSGRRPHVTWQYSKKDEEIAWAAMREMGVAELATKGFDQLSGGQKQRALISRAIAQEAEVYLLDEPTSNLDVKYQTEVLEIVRNLVRERDATACLIVHDLDLALKYCDRVVMLSDGKVHAAGETSEVLTPENVKAVYGIDIVIENLHGRDRLIIL